MRLPLIVWFKDVGKEDVSLVGGKGANLGEMTRNGFPVPNGFIVTAQAYFNFLEQNNLEPQIAAVLKDTKYDDTKSLNSASVKIKKLIVQGKFADSLMHGIYEAYNKLGGKFKDPLVAVRSSATAEDLPGASFAGQQETYLNVKGDANLIVAIKDAWASLFDARAIFYRHEQHYDHLRVGIAVPVQKMVESEMSGIMFSIDPVTNNKETIVIEGILGLGEMIVQGEVTPDHYEVDKKSLTITNKTIRTQSKELIKKGTTNKTVTLTKTQGDKQKVSDAHIVALAKLSKELEKHYYFPQDSEWAIEKGKVYLVQTRPITTVDKKDTSTQDEKTQEEALKVLLKGDPASPGIASGPVKILESAKEIGKIEQGDILVAPQTNPDFVPAMKKAAAIITDTGGRTSHAAIVSREIGIPAVVGTEEATKKLKDGMIITVDGGNGTVFAGGIHTTACQEAKEAEHLKTATHVYVNLAEPEFAEQIAKRHVDGVGLLRAEFMMAGIGTHPRAMIKEGRRKEFIDALAGDLATFCKAFSPRPVVYRASDFKTNEYRNLKGGKEYEPVEPNPMLGFRGAYRYINDSQVFELELEAIKQVRNKHNLKNLWLMIPFVRTVEELVEVKKIIAASGLTRGASFKLWMMVEIPSNVIMLDEFIDVGIDGVSIGSNDLTMLILGTDRDNDTVASEFDEKNPAVLWALERVIKTAHKHGITASLCGQAASEYPDLLEHLVRWGITSVSVSPDAIARTRETIATIEKKILRKE